MVPFACQTGEFSKTEPRSLMLLTTSGKLKKVLLKLSWGMLENSQ